MKRSIKVSRNVAACSFAVCALLGILSCTKATSLFSKLPARFTMENIYQAPVLYTACNSMGEFCTIMEQGQKYLFSNTHTTSTVNKTALTGYTGNYLGLSGLIVGLPNHPEMGQDITKVMCFDLACPNCYRDMSVAKRMTLQENGHVHCKTCGRTYDLNNAGIIDNDKEGIPLYRYRVSLLGNTLVVAN